MGPLAVLLLSSCRSMVPSFVALLLQILVGDAAENEPVKGSDHYKT